MKTAKYWERDALVAQRQQWRAEGLKVAFTNGCYDVLHPGHVRMLERARSEADLLVLGLNTDASVKRMKGESRPLMSQAERVAMALALEAVDAVTLFDEDTPRELIAALLPDVLVKGADWSHWIAGREEVEAAGGVVLALPLEAGFSTSNVLAMMLERNS
jgi:D-glycero-beta-D-manno-heptose 1-phosphate adenylyltransferase